MAADDEEDEAQKAAMAERIAAVEAEMAAAQVCGSRSRMLVGFCDGGATWDVCRRFRARGTRRLRHSFGCWSRSLRASVSPL